MDNIPAPARSKPPIGIAAGAEDAKYQVKYKELKRKVKDIEAVRPSSPVSCMCSPSSRTTTSCTTRCSRRNSASAGCRWSAREYPYPGLQRHSRSPSVLYERLAAVPTSPGPPAPPHQDAEHPPARPPAPPSPRIPIHSPRQAVHDAPRHHLPPLAPTHPHPHDPRAAPQHSPPARAAPRNTFYRGAPHHYDSAPPPQRRDEYGAGDPHPNYERHSVHPPLSPRAHPVERRVHAHQRLGPGTYIGRDDYPEPYHDRERDWDQRDREREREPRHRPRSSEYAREAPPMHSPHMGGGGRSSREYDAHAPPPPPPGAYYHEQQPAYGAPRLARADTPGSGSASGSGGAGGEVPAPPYYERRARSGSFRVREDGGGGGEYSGGFASDERAGGRKRSRADMEGESEHEGGGNAEGGYSHARRREGGRRRGDEDARMGAS